MSRTEKQPALTADQIAAMWVYGPEYAKQDLGIREWWAKQPAHRHAEIKSLLALLAVAPSAHGHRGGIDGRCECGFRVFTIEATPCAAKSQQDAASRSPVAALRDLWFANGDSNPYLNYTAFAAVLRDAITAQAEMLRNQQTYDAPVLGFSSEWARGWRRGMHEASLILEGK